jgi:hypothetical protein
MRASTTGPAIGTFAEQVFEGLSREPVNLVELDYHQPREVRQVEWVQPGIVMTQSGKFSQAESTELVFTALCCWW